jgi:hypothetical protein
MLERADGERGGKGKDARRRGRVSAVMENLEEAH